jgi:hypothetical protein
MSGFRGIAGGFCDTVDQLLNTTGNGTVGNITVRGCRMRYICGYDTDSDSYAFIEFEHEAAVKSGQASDLNGFQVYVQQNNIGGQLLDTVFQPGSVAMVDGVDDSKPVEGVRLSYFDDYSASYGTQVQGLPSPSGFFQAGFLRRWKWRTQYVYTHVRVGYSNGGSEELLFVDRIPRATGFRFHIACAKGLFSVWLHDSQYRFPYECSISLSPQQADVGVLSALSLIPSAVMGNGAFAAAFSLPDAISSGTNLAGWAVLPATKQQPDWSNMSGTFFDALPELKQQNPAVSHSQTVLTNPTTLFKLPCGDGFPNATDGFEYGSLVGNDGTTTPVECRLYVRNPDAGQFFSTSCRLNDSGFSEYIPSAAWPLGCADNPESIYVTLFTSDPSGPSLGGVPGYVFNGKHKMDRVPGTTAMYRVELAGFESTKAASYQYPSGLTYFTEKKVYNTAGFVWAEIVPVRFFPIVPAQKPAGGYGFVRWTVHAVASEATTRWNNIVPDRKTTEIKQVHFSAGGFNDFSSLPTAATQPLVRSFSLT